MRSCLLNVITSWCTALTIYKRQDPQINCPLDAKITLLTHAYVHTRYHMLSCHIRSWSANITINLYAQTSHRKQTTARTKRGAYIRQWVQKGIGGGLSSGDREASENGNVYRTSLERTRMAHTATSHTVSQEQQNCLKESKPRPPLSSREWTMHKERLGKTEQKYDIRT